MNAIQIKKLKKAIVIFDLFEVWELPLLQVYKRIDELYTLCFEKGVKVEEIVENQHYRVSGIVDYFPKSNKVHLLKANTWGQIKNVETLIDRLKSINQIN